MAWDIIKKKLPRLGEGFEPGKGMLFDAKTFSIDYAWLTDTKNKKTECPSVLIKAQFKFKKDTLLLEKFKHIPAKDCDEFDKLQNLY